MKRKFTVVALVIQLLLQTVNAKEAGPVAWRIKDLASAPIENIELRDRSNRIVGKVQTRQMLVIYSVMVALEEAAELNAELFVLEGKEPNAFATIGKDDLQVVGFTFGMLDLIGTDEDAAAAIIGHELAHLKLDHMKEKREAMENASTTTFSAAASRFTRDNEREADYLGAIWAVEAGYDPEGAVRVQEKLYKLSKRYVGFSGSHPSSIERLTVLKSLVRRLSK